MDDVDNKVEIALAADGGYFDQLYVTATSMATYARRDAQLSFNILDGGITSTDWDYLVEKVTKCHPSCTFSRIPVDERLFANYPKWNGNRMAYARLLLPDALKEKDWMLYSDCDFLWLRDVAELWLQRDERFAVVAVRDIGSWEKKEQAWFKKNGYSIDGSQYFCSGMCLFNLKKFRDANLIHEVSNVLISHPDVPYVDQTALNIVCAGSVKLVSRKWMCFTHELTNELHSALAVIHHAGEVPWKFSRISQLLSDTMLMWHDFNAQMRGISRWTSLRKYFSVTQIVWHRLLSLVMRCVGVRFLVKVLCHIGGHDGAYKYLYLRSHRFALPTISKKFWQITEERGVGCHAGPKAPRDVETIVSKMGWVSFGVKRNSWGKGSVLRFLSRIAWWLRCRKLRKELPSHSVLLMQYPSAAYSRYRQMSVITLGTKQRKNIRLLVLLHDLASLRWGDGSIGTKCLSDDERELLDLADKIIVHNKSMARVLHERGIVLEKIVELYIFDYLTFVTPKSKVSFHREVSIAGCLSPDKVGYLGQISRIPGVCWRLYGEGFDAKRFNCSSIIYEGRFSPEELPGKMTSGFGLVWDGPSAATCEGCLGEYMRINNPHKLSLYLVSGLPVLIWESAAEAEFVKSNGLGLLIHSLWDIPHVLLELSAADYDVMRQNVLRMSEKLREGYYTKRAIERCVHGIC